MVLDRLAAEGGFRFTIGASGVALTLQPHSSSGALPASTINARLAGGEIAGDAGKRDIVHFPYDRASYTLSDPCDRSLCTVSGVPGAAIVNGDLLVFSDQELPLR